MLSLVLFRAAEAAAAADDVETCRFGVIIDFTMLFLGESQRERERALAFRERERERMENVLIIFRNTVLLTTSEIICFY